MKALCIDGDWEGVVKNPPIENNIYNVNGSGKDEEGNWYMLLEYPNDNYFAQEAFIPLSDIDEMELIKERKNILVNS
jgi:hypothetical protein